MSVEARSLHNVITTQLLPRSNQIHTQIHQFLLKQVQDFQQISRENRKVTDQIKTKGDIYEQNVAEIKSKKSKDQNFMEKGHSFLTAKGDEIKAKNKAIDSVSTGMKESVTKIKPASLADLPVEKQQTLKNMFQTLLEILYREKLTSFVWKEFKEKALLFENGQDFIYRLVNINFKEMPQAHHNSLLQLKNDQKLDELCVNSKHASSLIDFANWLDYVCMGCQLSNQKKACEHQYDKIRRDIDTRSNSALQMSEKFWQESLLELQAYQNNLMNLQAELQTMLVGMRTSTTGLVEAQTSRNAKIAHINTL